ncbi:cupin domain-containing protein [Mycolicibacterium goodii]|uniref:cupin domain-containing protein n=1 Tax=Mycolicibacterium goodii TaxID=134601 RepID=UPI00067314EE
MNCEIARGTTVQAGPLATTFEITGEMVDNAYCVVRQTVKAGTLFWPHVHVNEDQVITVLSGELGVRVGDREWTASAGDTVYRPKGIPHAVWNSGTVDVVMLEITSPGNFDQYLVGMAEVTASGDAQARAALLERFQISPVPGWSEDLCARHGVTE